MVQTHPDDQLRRQPKHFWKVHAKYDTSVQEYRERLQTANFTLTKRCSKRLRARLPVLDSRAQRGMLIYEKCTYRELRTFCKQRGINAGTDRSVPKTQLIRLLETADTTCVFPFFEGLPPEMRLRIYAFSFQFFRHDVQSANVKPEPQLILYHMYYKDPGQHNPWNTTGPDMVRTSEDQQDNRAYSVLKLCPPPLSHICGLLRREVLPLFYTKSTLRFEVVGKPAQIPGDKHVWHSSDHDGMQNGKFFWTAPPELLRCVRKIAMNVRHIDQKYERRKEEDETITLMSIITRRVEAEFERDGTVDSLRILSAGSVEEVEDSLEQESEPDGYQGMLSQDIQGKVLGLPEKDWLMALRWSLLEVEKNSG